MKVALLKAPFQVEIRDIDKPSPKANELLIKVKATCVCGSDLHAYRGKHPFRNPPVILGHELAGEVENVGKKVQKFQPGDRVTIEPWTHCGKCSYCVEGKYNLCLDRRAMGTSEWRGSFAEHVVAPEDSVYNLAREISYEEGALVEPLAVGVHTVRQARVNLGEDVAILGAGPIGLVILTCLCECGAIKTIITDIEDFNLEIAKRLGATETVNVREKSPQTMIDEFTNRKGVDTVIIAAGEESLVNEAIRIVRKGGKIVVPAIFDEPPEVDMFKLVYAEQNIQGSWAYTRKDFDTAIELLTLGKIDLEPIITHRFPLSEARKVFDILDKRSEEVIKILFTF